MAARNGKKLRLADASEEHIEEMVTTGDCAGDDDDGDHEETSADKEHRGVGKAKPKDPKLYSVADPVEVLGRRLIEEHHPHLKHQKVVYIFCSEARKKLGQPVLASTAKVSGRPAWMAQCLAHEAEGEGDAFFVIEVSSAHWELMSEASRLALIDHQLSFCGVRESSGALYLRQPDVQEFREVAMRRGYWRLGIQSRSSLKQ
jgi:predicted metallopeptidase